MSKKFRGILLALFVSVAVIVSSLSVVSAATSSTVKITKQPVSVTALNGYTAKATVTATGSGLTYKWYYKNAGDSDFVLTESFKGKTYSVKMNDERNGRKIYCIVTDSKGKSVQSNTVTLTSGKITKQPVSVSAISGKTAKVSFSTRGSGLTYTWYYKNKGASKYTRTDTFTGKSYSVSMNKARNGRMVYCKVTDKYGNSVKTDAVTLKMGYPTKITKQPTSVTVLGNSTAKVSLKATGIDLTYKWYYKNVNSSSFKYTSTFKGSTYTVDMNDARSGRQIYCVVTDKYGNAVKSKVVTLKKGEITKQPESVTVKKGETAKTTISATGDGLTYKWYYKNAGASSYSLTTSFTGKYYSVAMNESRDGRKIFCRITDKYGNSLDTKTVTLSMKHSYDEGTVVRDATCTLAGEKVFKCKDCSKEKTEVIDKLPHNLTEAETIRESTVYDYGIERQHCSNCSYYNDSTIDKQTPVYTITLYSGIGAATTYEVGENGAYNIPAPYKLGYDFVGWRDKDSNTFDSKGKIFENIELYGSWEVSDTTTLSQLMALTDAGVDKIKIAADITVNKPIFISYNTTIYADGEYTLKRDPSYKGDIFVVGVAKNGQSSVNLNRKAVLNLGSDSGTLTIDGNRDEVKVDVAGSAVIVSDSGTLNLYDGVVIANNKKVANERIYNSESYVGTTVTQRAGGAAVLNVIGTVNMYGGVIENNIVTTTHTVIKDANGVEQSVELAGCGGAVYNNSNFHMYGGTIRNNEALRGGGIYNNKIMFLNAGTISDNISHTYGGAVSSSSGSLSDNHIGTQDGSESMLIKNNHSKKAGGGIYSNTSSAIVVYGNTKFEGNSTETSGGAIYTAGPLTVKNADFSKNYAEYSGGAIYNHYSNPDYDRRFFTVSGTNFSENSSGLGGAIILSAASEVGTTGTKATITDCTFNENKGVPTSANSGTGGAIYVTRYSEATISNCEFVGNSAASTGGAVSAHSNSKVDLPDCTFINNSASTAGALNVASGASVKMTNIEFRENKALFGDNNGAGNGGALCVADATIAYSNIDFYNNHADNNAGAIYLTNYDMTLDSKCDFVGNSAGGHGGAIYLTYKTVDGVKDGSNITADNVTFKDNYAQAGGAISIRSACSATLNSVTLSGNYATGDKNDASGGGAIYVGYGELTLTDVTATDNSSVGYGGVVNSVSSTVKVANGEYSNNTAGSGGVVNAITSSTVTMSNAKFKDNESTNKVADTTLGGGVVGITSGNLTVVSCDMDGNTSGYYGGAVYGRKSTVNISADTSFNNSSGVTGGALYFRENCTATLNNITLSNNNASSNGVVYANGGTLTVTNVPATDNNAGSGGVLYTSGGSTKVYVNKCSWTDNTAKNGGAIYLSDATVNLNDSDFSKNTSNLGGAVYNKMGKCNLNRVTFTENKAQFDSNGKNGNGGAITLVGAVMDIDETVVINNNTADNHGGAVYVSYIKPETEGAENVNGTLNAINATFDNNRAMAGGAVSVRTGCSAVFDNTAIVNNSVSGDDGKLDGDSEGGGAIYVGYGSVSLVNSTLTNNTSDTYGGAIDAAGATVTIDGCDVSSNSAMSGGAIKAITKSSVTINNVTLNNNESTYENVDYNSSLGGGAVDMNGGNLTISKTTLDGNVSDYYGGALLVSNAVVDINDNTVVKNSSGKTGAAINLKSCTSNLENITITENTAITNGVVYINGGTTEMKSVTATNNTAKNGGVIYTSNGKTVLNIDNCTLSDNTATNGGIVYADSATVNISNCSVPRNTATSGGAVYSVGANVNITKTPLDGFSTNMSGGAINATDGTTKITDTTVTNNSSQSNGGALYIYGGTLEISNVSFENNSANNNGGAVDIVGATATITGDCSFTNNTAVKHGGAIYVTYSTDEDTGEKTGGEVYMLSGVFENNTALGGGAVSIRTDSQADFDNTVFINNSVSGDDGKADGNGEGGGAVYVGYGDATFVGCSLKNNTSSTFGDSIDALNANVYIDDCDVSEHSSSVGSVVYLKNCTSVINNTNVSNNTSLSNGVIYANGGTADLTHLTATNNTANRGGVVYTSGASTVLNIDASTFKNNSSPYGGAVYSDKPTVNISNSSFSDNDATSNGGALYFNAGAVTIKDSDFDNNSSSSNGGAVDIVGATATITGDCNFTNNTAVSHGGAIYVSYIKGTDGADNIGGVLNMTDGMFENNNAMGGGAVSIRTSSKATFDNTTFTNNSVSGCADGTEDGNAEGGGAVYVGYGSLSLTNATMTNNTSDTFGGAIDAAGATATVDGGTYSANTAVSGGAIKAINNSTVTISNAVLNENESTYVNTDYNNSFGGGAVDINGGKLLVYNTEFDSNVSDYYGGAILARSVKELTIADNSVIKNTTIGTGALYLLSCTSTIENTSILDNTASSNGVIYVSGGSLDIAGVSASGNTSGNGGVLYCSGGSTTVDIINSNISNNTATTGGVVYMSDASVTVNSSVFEDNTSQLGGAIFNKNGSLDSVDSKFVNNTATKNSSGSNGNGGAITLSGGSFTASGSNEFSSNSAENHGGAVYVAYSTVNEQKVPGLMNMTDGLFTQNTAQAGGAISSRTDCVVTLNGTILQNNSAAGTTYELGGGAIYSNNNTLKLSAVSCNGNSTGYYGGAINARTATVTIDNNSIFTNNEGKTGVAIHLRDGGTATLTDVTVSDNVATAGSGVVYITGAGSLDITRMTATGNQNNNGGVIYSSGSANISVADSDLSSNTALNLGGAIDHRSSGALTVTNTEFTGNTAKNGGAMYTTNSKKVSVSNSTYTENSATEKGGSVYAVGTKSESVFDNCLFNGNSAVSGGAVCADQGAKITINAGGFASNSANDGGAVMVADSSEEGTAATSMYLNAVEFTKNTASNMGGALSTDTASPNLVINATDCIFTENSATVKGGGAVEIGNGNCNSASGPAQLNLVFTNCTFDSNTAKTTGAAVEIRSSSCAKFDGITAKNNKSTGNGSVFYITSNYSRLYLTGDVTLSDNTAKSGTFAYLYNNNYSNPPMIYTSHSSTADWYTTTAVTGNRTNVAFDVVTMP